MELKMHFTRFATFLKFLGIKVGRADFLYRGQLDQRPLTSGPEDPRRHPRWTRSTLVSEAGQGHVGQHAGRLTGDDRRGTRRRGRTETRRGALRWFGRAAAETKWSPGHDAGDRRSSCKRQCSAGWLAGAETEGERVHEDQGLTRISQVMSAWPEEGCRGRI
jgi:hypothetical protein